MPSGACFALAANVRPIYAVALWQQSFSLLLCSPGDERSPYGCANRGVRLGYRPCARSAVSDQRPHASFAQSIRTWAAGPTELYMQQLAWGVAIQKYETNIGGDFPVAVMFLDARGQELMLPERSGDPRLLIARRRLGHARTFGWSPSTQSSLARRSSGTCSMASMCRIQRRM